MACSAPYATKSWAKRSRLWPRNSRFPPAAGRICTAIPATGRGRRLLSRTVPNPRPERGRTRPRQHHHGTSGKLPPVFSKTGSVTAGNASGITDGSSALVLASSTFVKKHNLQPLATWWSGGRPEPARMGLGPVPAIQAYRQKFGDNFQRYEINEAFAAQALAYKLKLDLRPSTSKVAPSPSATPSAAVAPASPPPCSTACANGAAAAAWPACASRAAWASAPASKFSKTPSAPDDTASLRATGVLAPGSRRTSRVRRPSEVAPVRP